MAAMSWFSPDRKKFWELVAYCERTTGSPGFNLKLSPPVVERAHRLGQRSSHILSQQPLESRVDLLRNVILFIFLPDPAQRHSLDFFLRDPSMNRISTPEDGLPRF